MNNATHYFKAAWNNEYHCAQCGEYITADRHIRAPRDSLLETLMSAKAARESYKAPMFYAVRQSDQ